MRIVPNLNDMDECPNCESRGFISNHNQFGRLYKLCPVCHEEFFENEITCSEEKIIKKKEKENFIFEMREEINHLTQSIHDARSMVLVENIQNIFNKIIDYIEEN